MVGHRAPARSGGSKLLQHTWHTHRYDLHRNGKGRINSGIPTQIYLMLYLPVLREQKLCITSFNDQREEGVNQTNPPRTQQPLEDNSRLCTAELCISLPAGTAAAQHHLLLSAPAASYHSRDLLAHPRRGAAEVTGRTSVTRERDWHLPAARLGGSLPQDRDRFF